MGDLVFLTPRAAPAAGVVAGESAAILFFTGVRYYRFEDHAAPLSAAASRTSANPKRRRSTKPRKSRRAALVELHG